MLSIEELGRQITNPASGKSLLEEARLKKASMEGENYIVEYRRDGISTEDKRKIEDQVIKALEGKVPADKILVKTVSDQPAPAAAAAPAAGAQLKTGHGPAGAKRKRVPGVKKVIAVGSGKGGVGKSTVSTNLAIALANTGAKVGLLDADVYGPSVPMLMGKRDAKPRASEEKKILPESAFGVKFMSFGFFINEDEPVIWRGPMLGGVLNQFLFDVDWGELDFLIIDLPPGTGDMQLSMVQATEVDGALIVTTPQDVAVLDAAKGLKMFEQVKVPVIGVIENMAAFVCDQCDKVHNIFGSGGGKQMAQKLGVPYLAAIPLETSMRTGSDEGRPYMSLEHHAKRPAWQAFTTIAQDLQAPEPSGPTKSKGLMGRLFGR